MFESIRWTWGTSSALLRGLFQGERLYRELKVEGSSPVLAREFEVEVQSDDYGPQLRLIANSVSSSLDASSSTAEIAFDEDSGTLRLLIRQAYTGRIADLRILPYALMLMNAVLGVAVNVRLGPWTACEHQVKIVPCDCDAGIEDIVAEFGGEEEEEGGGIREPDAGLKARPPRFLAAHPAGCRCALCALDREA